MVGNSFDQLKWSENWLEFTMFCCSASFLIKTQNKDLHCRLDFTSCVAMAVDIPLLLPVS